MSADWVIARLLVVKFLCQASIKFVGMNSGKHNTSITRTRNAGMQIGWQEEKHVLKVAHPIRRKLLGGDFSFDEEEHSG